MNYIARDRESRKMVSRESLVISRTLSCGSIQKKIEKTETERLTIEGTREAW